MAEAEILRKSLLIVSRMQKLIGAPEVVPLFIDECYVTAVVT